MQPGLDHMGRRAWRKVLSVGFVGGWDALGVWTDTEMQYERQTRPQSEWHEIDHDYRHAWIGGPWLWGERHDYYDGPHCSRHFGFLHFGWSAGWCLKCMPPHPPDA